MIKQEIIRDKDFNVIEYKDNYKHIKYSNNRDIIYYKIDNFEYINDFNNIESNIEQTFIDIIKDGVIEIDEIKYSDRVFLFKNEKLLFRYDFKTGIIWFNYDLLWSSFELKYGMGYEEIQYFIKSMMEEHFKCKGITTWDDSTPST